MAARSLHPQKEVLRHLAADEFHNRSEAHHVGRNFEEDEVQEAVATASEISFSIAPASGWDARTGTTSAGVLRRSDAWPS
ncbi:hypothetical protein GCM10022233_40900 [Streptomyces shaanxiensis]|uniref:Uncharacterized protein n=1 Tax=Streptomyces shaanxiensis TaxID=653357 RepID=A0ABP7VA98_9ACTN